jgi:signal peptidase I
MSDSEIPSIEAQAEASAAANEAAAAGEGEAPAAKQPGKLYLFWREWIKPLAVIGLVMFSFRSAIADWNDVPTGSMKPTILEGDRIFINKVAYDLKFPFTTFRIAQWDDPKWGDVVVLRSPDDGKRLVKRVIGLPGDVIELRGDRLYRNGRAAIYSALDNEVVDQLEPQERVHFTFGNEEVDGRQHPVMVLRGSAMHLQAPFGPFEIPADSYFMMGDNRNNSRDSRYFGTVHRSEILGRAVGVALSLDRKNWWKPRWDRFFSKLP